MISRLRPAFQSYSEKRSSKSIFLGRDLGRYDPIDSIGGSNQYYQLPGGSSLFRNQKFSRRTPIAAFNPVDIHTGR
jgi:hypothetical protein